MNILIVDQFSQPGGAQQGLINLLPEVRARGWHAHMLAPGDGELIRWCREHGVPVYPLPLGSYSSGGKNALDILRYAFDVPRMMLAIRRIVADQGIDLVHINGARALPGAWNINRRVVFHAHSPVSGTLPRGLTELMVRRSRASVIAVSKFVALRYPDARVIYNGVPDYGPVRKVALRATRIGLVGRIAPEKGHLDFVSAARTISEVSPDSRFFVYGERLFSEAGYDRRVREAAQNLPVEFCGWKNDAGAIMRNLDILVVPSDPTEAATRVIMEAFSAGTPVVAYRSGGIPELVDHGRTGLLVDWPDAAGLARAILSLIGDFRTRERLSVAGRTEWERRFDIGIYRARLCDALAEIESGKSKAASAVAGEDVLAGLGTPDRR